MKNPVQQILDAILGLLLGIWILGGAYLTFVGMMYSFWLGLYGLVALAAGLLVALMVFLTFRK
jgi:hypothetical protein